MTVYSQRNQANTSFWDNMVLPDTLKPCTPETKSVSIIRIIPEPAADGTFKPAVMKLVSGDRPGVMVPDISNCVVESAVINAGTKQKFTGLTTPSDMIGVPDIRKPFSGLYIMLRGRQKKGSLSPYDNALIAQHGLLTPDANNRTPLAKAEDYMLFQCIVYQDRGKMLPAPEARRFAVLRTSAIRSLEQVIMMAHNQGIDIFSPEHGVQLVIQGIPGASQNSPPSYSVSLGQKAPIPADFCKQAWMPWEQVLRRYSFDEHIKNLCAAYTPEVASMVFGPDVERVLGRSFVPQTGVAQFAPPAQQFTQPGAAPLQGAPQQPVYGWPQQAPQQPALQQPAQQFQMPQQAAPAPVMSLPANNVPVFDPTRGVQVPAQPQPQYPTASAQPAMPAPVMQQPVQQVAQNATFAAPGQPVIPPPAPPAPTGAPSNLANMSETELIAHFSNTLAQQQAPKA